MKALIFTLALTLAQVAAAWETVFECNNRSIVIDEQCHSYHYVDCSSVSRRLVINDTEIVSYFEKNGIVQGNAEGRFIADYVVQESDNYIVKTTANGIPVLMKLHKNGSGLRLEGFHFQEKPTAHGTQIILSESLADWNFQNCK